MGLLDDLIAESKALQAQEKQKKAKQKEEQKRQATLAKERAKYLPYTAAISEPGWEPAYRVIHLVRQHCKECGNVTEYIGGIGTRAYHARLHAYRDINYEPNDKLPAIVDAIDMHTPLCPHCLESVPISGHAFLDSISTQTDLFL